VECGIKWHQFVRNDAIAANTTTGLPSISETISRRRNALFGHVTRLPDDVRGSQGTQLPSQPISRHTTKQPVASPSRSSSQQMGWPDPEWRNDKNLPPVDLWRHAVSRGHRGV